MVKRLFLSLLLLCAAAGAWAAECPRAEYPRPQFERQDWLNLKGDWTYTFDFVGSGMEKRLFENSEVFIDGRLAGRHFGGSTSFSIDVTRFLSDGAEHSLVVHAYSDTRTTKQPAGKQNVRLNQFECMYTRTTGIWQTVWMEPVDENALLRTQVITDIDQSQVIVHPTFYRESPATLTTAGPVSLEMERIMANAPEEMAPKAFRVLQLKEASRQLPSTILLLTGQVPLMKMPWTAHDS